MQTPIKYFVNKRSVVREIWGKSDTILFIFAGASAEFALNKAVDWLYFTGKLPADPLGRLFSTVTYARQIVFSELHNANAAIDKITAIHTAVENKRDAKIPDWAYRDVLFMLIHYSLAAFELLERKLNEGKHVEVAIKVLEKYFEEFTKKHYEKIQRGFDLTDEQLREVINQIIKLNPKPAGSVGESSKAESYVVPDFFIYNNAGKLELTLNNKNAPELRISEGYRDMLKEYDRGSKKDKRQKEAVIFIKQKIDAAKWFIDAIKQRHNTLLNTMESIMNYQREFFISGEETDLRPMILKHIAEDTNLDISTVSRVANSKFVQTEFGTYRLKFFFSESLQTDSGEEVSTREVKKILSDIIEAEDKKHPYSDEKLTEMLQEKGYNIARRTVAKYREQLNISVARLRKEL